MDKPSVAPKRLLKKPREQLCMLEDITIIDSSGAPPSWSISGDELARLVNLARSYPTVQVLTTAEEVGERLRGLAGLFRLGVSDAEGLDPESYSFLESAMHDLAARLDASPRGDGYRVLVGATATPLTIKAAAARLQVAPATAKRWLRNSPSGSKAKRRTAA
jgi:hypothetical protein